MDKGLSSRVTNLLLWVFLAAIVLLSAIKLLFPADDYRQQVTQHLADHAGQPIKIVGSLEWYLSPFPSLFASSMVAPNSNIAFQDVSISFNLLDLLLLKAVPSDIEIAKVTSISNLKSVPLIEHVVIGFDPSGTRPNTFEFVVDHAALSPNKSPQTTPLNRLNLKMMGDIQYLDAGRYHINGRLTKTGTIKQHQSSLFDDTSLQLDVAEGDRPNTHVFDLSVSAGSFNASSNGVLQITKKEISVTFNELKTPNMSLSGQSMWQAENASIKSTLQGQHIMVPTTCFEPSSSAYCYDLAMLMMLPGKSTLQVNTLETYQQTLQDIDLDWTFEDGEIAIHKATAQAIGGMLNIEGRYKLASNSGSFDLLGENIQIETLLQAMGRKPQLYGAANINLKGRGQFKGHQLLNHKIEGKVNITNGKTTLFNLEKELCSQVKSVVVTDSIATPFEHLSITIDEENHHLKIPYFVSELDGASINGQGEIAQDQTVELVMNVRLDKEEWALCTLPRALTGIEWPLTCNKSLRSRGDCSINFKQMGLSALLLADDPDRKDKAKQQVQTLKKNDNVKKVLSRLEKWLDE